MTAEKILIAKTKLKFGEKIFKSNVLDITNCNCGCEDFVLILVNNDHKLVKCVNCTNIFFI